MIYSLPHEIKAIDLMEGGPGRSAGYLIKGESSYALIETGSSLSVPYILEALEELSVSPEQIKYVIVTHIHLDHSGGVGTLLPHVPSATVVVHPRGARHLIDPSRLIEGARAVYGARLESYFGDILPVPEERVLIREDGETIDLGGGRIFTFYDTPGHAKHHFSIYDPVSEGIFVGDTVGIRYDPTYTGWDFVPIFPSTSPTDFDRDAVFASCAKLEALSPKRLYHTHFGMTEPATEGFDRIRYTTDAYDKIAREAVAQGITESQLGEQLREFMRLDLAVAGHPVESLDVVNLDLTVNSMGLLYAIKREMK